MMDKKKESPPLSRLSRRGEAIALGAGIAATARAAARAATARAATGSAGLAVAGEAQRASAGRAAAALAPALLFGLLCTPFVLAGCGGKEVQKTAAAPKSAAVAPAPAEASMVSRVRMKPRREKRPAEPFNLCDERFHKKVNFHFDDLVYADGPKDVERKDKDGGKEVIHLAMDGIPEGFPAGFPIYKGAKIIKSGKLVRKGGLDFLLNLKTNDDYSRVSAYYKKALKDAGYKIGTDLSPCNKKIMRIMAEKDENDSATVAIYQDSEGTFVLIQLLKKTEEKKTKEK